MQSDPDNVKALFRRAKANVGAWNWKEAEDDFLRVSELDASLENLVHKELLELEKLKKAKDIEDKAKFLGKIF